MFKKVALAAAIAATASFATYNYFPVLDNHKGQVTIGEADVFQDKSTVGILYVKGRYTVIPNLELGLDIPFVVVNYWDGDDTEHTGLDNITLMGRYQFMPTMNAFLDFALPTCNDDICGDDDHFTFHFGAQYSQKFGMIDFGSELGLALETKGKDKATPPWTLNLGLEGDFLVSQMFVPYVGLDLGMLLGKYTNDGEDGDKSYTGKFGIAPFLGANINFNQMFTLGLGLNFLVGGKDYLVVKTGRDEVKTTFDIHLDINF